MKYPEDYINKIICGDCLVVMKGIPDESVDAVVTDPPFGIGFKYNQHKDQSTPEDYWKYFSPIYAEILRVCKNGAFISIWQTNKYHKHLWSWYGDDIRIYAGCKNFVQLRKTPINYGYDPIVMRYKGFPELRPVKPKRNLDFFVANTAKFVTETKSIAREHPCPRPIDQVETIIDNFTKENGVVLDPFMGSGTTAVACNRNKRDFIGIEISPEYCEISKRRLEQKL